MHILIAPNSFKNCLSAAQVGAAMSEGARTACPGAKVRVIPLADGGDGFVEALAAAGTGELQHTDVLDPLGRPIDAAWLKTVSVTSRRALPGMKRRAMLRPMQGAGQPGVKGWHGGLH